MTETTEREATTLEIKSDTPAVSPQSPRLLDQMRDRIRVKHYSLSTEKTYLYWVRFFIRWSGMRHPRDMSAADVEAFLSYLATQREVSAGTQNQAMHAILFLYRDVLDITLPWLDGITRAKPSKRLPVVLTIAETQRLLAATRGTAGLVVRLLYGTGMRLRECYTLTADQIDLPARTIHLDKTKNGDSRQVPLSSVAVARLQVGTIPQTGQVFPWWSGTPSADELRRVTALLSRQFARIFAAAGCPDFKFHDLRHEATSRLFEKTTLSEFEIAKITGHRSPRMLMRYANLRGSDLAQKLW